MNTKSRLIRLRWAYCFGSILLVCAGVLVLTSLAAAQSPEAGVKQDTQAASPLATNRYVAKTGLDSGACTDPLAPCATFSAMGWLFRTRLRFG
jgi:hypothetical protein